MRRPVETRPRGSEDTVLEGEGGDVGLGGAFVAWEELHQEGSGLEGVEVAELEAERPSGPEGPAAVSAMGSCKQRDLDDSPRVRSCRAGVAGHGREDGEGV